MSKAPPDLTAAMDQQGMVMQGIARIQGEYFGRLLQEGFERAEALVLVQQHFEDLMWRSDDDES